MDRSFLLRSLRAGAPAYSAFPNASPSQRRCFSQTPANAQDAAPHIVFDTEVSPGLKPVLTEIQNKIILPSYVPLHQRRRLFQDKFRSSLKFDPVIIEIDGLTHRFPFLGRSEMPKTVKIVKDAIVNMHTTQDFANFNRLLAGIQNAGRVIDLKQWITIIRMIGSKGHIFSVIEAARQVKKTGLKLDNPLKVHELLFFIQLKAMHASWDVEELDQSLRWARVVIEMAAHPKHLPEAHRKTPEWLLEYNVDRDPLAIAAPLHLAAVRALAYQDGKDTDGTVAGLVDRLTKLWPAGKTLIELYPAGSREPGLDEERMTWLERPQLYIPKVLMALHGLQIATKVVADPVLLEKLKGVVAGLEAELVGKIGALPDGMKVDSTIDKIHRELYSRETGEAQVLLDPAKEEARLNAEKAELESDAEVAAAAEEAAEGTQQKTE